MIADDLSEHANNMVEVVKNPLPVYIELFKDSYNRHRDQLRLHQLNKNGVPTDDTFKALFFQHAEHLADVSLPSIISTMSNQYNSTDHYIFTVYRNAYSYTIQLKDNTKKSCVVDFIQNNTENLWPNRNVSDMLRVNASSLHQLM